MSNSSEGKILLNILKSLPKRGIWMIRQEGAWVEDEGRKTGRERSFVVIHKSSVDTSAQLSTLRNRNVNYEESRHTT